MSATPILSGFHPDPSICRVGDDYFLVTSSFEYVPGVPVFVSRDLVNWRQIGNVLERSSQLSVRAGITGASGGIYAPSLRHHDGRFWMTTTSVHDVAGGHLIVHADDAAGPWSDPVRTAGLIGIDPDLSWDDEGVCRLTWSDVVRGGISQADIDPFSGAVVSEVRQLWGGTGGAHAEGPHLVRRGRWWYLLVAEGGTGPGHTVTVARSRTPRGPFESNPANPILTHRSTSDAVQSTGHADLVELADGTWALVHLGTRPRGSFPRWHTNGRETFLAGVDWVDDWPVVDESRFVVEPGSAGFDDEFLAVALNPRWVSPGVDPHLFAESGERGLILSAGRGHDSTDAVHLLCARAVDEYWSAQVWTKDDLALSVRIDDRHQVIIERVGEEAVVRVVIGPIEQAVARTAVPQGSVVLEIRSEPFDAPRGVPSGPDRLVLGWVADGGFRELASLDGRYLSTEVAGGFTGRVIGLEAIGRDAHVTRFRYRPSEGGEG